MRLLARVIEAIGIEGAHPKSSPSETKALPYDKTGNITQPSFNYASVIVMFRYFQGHTKPNISFASSQYGSTLQHSRELVDIKKNW